jgi:hypothetical protein
VEPRGRGHIPPYPLSPSISAILEANPVCFINRPFITDCPSRFLNFPPALRDKRELVVGLEEHKSPLRIMIMD